MCKINFKKTLPYIGSILFMIILSYIYFSPDILEGKVLFQGDTQQGIAIGQEGKAFREATGETTRWTNSLFSGMPNFQISPSYANNYWMGQIGRIYHLGLQSPASLVFIMMLGFFILLSAMKIRWYLALVGAIAYAFSSYFFIIIGAGHIWKFITLAYIPPTIAGIILAYRGKYIGGAALIGFFGMMQITSNHIQMSYYFMFFIAALVIAYFFDFKKRHELPQYFKATGVIICAGLLAIGANIPSLYNTYEYSKETMRGQAELTNANEKISAKSGLDTEYITHWSYGIGETWSLLIPNVKGGATGAIAKNTEAMQKADPSVREYVAQIGNHYWGNQPGTAGPVYVGAFVMLLFILGCFIVKGPLKWAILAATILTVLLSWGKNFLPLTEFFIEYFPMYNKFRTVSSILVVAEFCIPLLAILALKEIITNPRILIEKKRESIISFALTGGISLLFFLFPGLFFNFLSSEEQVFMGEHMEYRDVFYNLELVRESIFTDDALRSFLFILAGSIVLFLFAKGKINKTTLVALCGIIILADMYPVNKRYLNSENFVSAKKLKDPFPMTEIDKQILADPDPNYRVYNLLYDPFNDAITSYRHKSIGGYHAAKLRRYDDLIKYQLSKNNPHVINMLNTKYFILPGENGAAPQVVQNPEAAGNAWFVSEIKWVENAEQEMKALDDFNEKKTVIADRHFADKIKTNISAPAAGDTIFLTSYKPNELKYKSHTSKNNFAVFSEIYFPWGWHISIDGEPVEMARVNYVLRGLDIPSGDHEIIFRFDPQSIHITVGIAFVCIGLILILGIIAIYTNCRTKKVQK